MLRIVFTLMFVAMFSVSCSQNSKKPAGVPIDMKGNAGGEAAMNPHGDTAGQEAGFSRPTNASVLLPEIDARYSGVTISVNENKTKKEKVSMTVPFKKRTALKPTDLEIEVESYFTNFTMDATGAINKSMSEDNPVVKVKVYKKDAVIFDGWLFQNFADMHQFEDPNYSLVMVGGVKK